MGKGDGVPKACRQQAAADSRGSRTCVCANTNSLLGVAHEGEEGRIGVANTSSESQRRKNRAARKGKWSPRGTGNRQGPPFLKCAQVTGKAGENGQHSGGMGGSSPWTRPSAPVCGDTLKAPASDQRLIVLEDGSGVAIDWVTGRSYSSARRRRDV